MMPLSPAATELLAAIKDGERVTCVALWTMNAKAVRASGEDCTLAVEELYHDDEVTFRVEGGRTLVVASHRAHKRRCDAVSVQAVELLAGLAKPGIIDVEWFREKAREIIAKTEETQS